MTLSSSKPRYTRLEPAQFEALVRAYEDCLSGRRSGVGVSTGFLLARGMKADRRTLRDVNFTGSDLSGTSFADADLRRASFYCCNLSRCDFRRARMERADLRGCSFAGANLSGATLDEADMRSAVLCANDEVLGIRQIAGGRLDRANLDDAHPHAVDFTDCSMSGVRMKNANLKNANFSGANLNGADLAGARLGGARFDGAILTGVDVERLGLPKAALAGCVTDPTPEAMDEVARVSAEIDLGHAWVSTNGKAGRPAQLDGCDLRPAGELLRNRLLVGLSARAAMAVAVDFTDSELAGANFDGADLRAAVFTGADLRGASFRDAKLTHACFARADIAPLSLRDGTTRATVFDGANLEGTGLSAGARPPVE